MQDDKDFKTLAADADSDFSPYYANGIIAIDTCTAFSRKVNCMVLEDEIN